eukprot:TRINITY_DN5491_c0_g1_i1.p1 TRINITY_DN5491_c0_g1~~TRINITY_DN5491_c0_g1_i1.p1  ORF type:complete len:284 (-),score=57.36 TRINITY_DN5491_c0_g1_i1:133-984(-)
MAMQMRIILCLSAAALLVSSAVTCDGTSPSVGCCLGTLFEDCQLEMVELLSNVNPDATTVQALKTCATNSSVSNVQCSTYLDSAGNPTSDLTIQLQSCAAEYLGACPLQMSPLIVLLTAAKARLATAGGKLSTAELVTITTKTRALFTCLNSATHISDTCKLIIQEEEEEIEREEHGHGSGGTHQTDTANNHDGKHGDGSDDDHHGGGGLIVLFVLVVLVAAAAAGVTYYVMKRKRQAQQLLNQLDMEAVVVQGKAVDSAPIGGAVVYANVPSSGDGYGHSMH